jgi:hypothetical protein
MDLTFFIQHKEEIEVALKSGLYLIQQSHLPEKHQAFRCGLAGKPADFATRAFQSQQSSFSSRFANYLNYWLPTDAKVYACLTVPRVIRAGFSERILTEREEGDNREDYAREYQTLIQVREAQFHNLLKSYGMQRLGLPGVVEEKKRSEFFRGSLATAKRALKAIGVGEYYEFPSNDISEIRKITLTRGETIETQAVKLRESPRLVANRETVEKLSRNEPATVRAIQKVTEARRSPRLDTTPVMVTMREKDLDRLRMGDPQMVNAVTRLKDITPVRRSSRLRGVGRFSYRE